MWHAYIDESEPNHVIDPGSYILAAALLEDADLSSARQYMTALRRTNRSKLHWHSESDRSRKALVEFLADMPALHVVVVHLGEADVASERRRRKCFERLAYELDGRGVSDVTVEAREYRSNTREQNHFNRLRSGRVVSSDMRIHHIEGPGEPLLWIADIVAGATAAARTGRPEYLGVLTHLVDMVLVDRRAPT